MNPYAVGPLFAIVALLQSAATSRLRVMGASPDLTLVLAVACALRWGVRESLGVILVGGLMVDVLSGAPFGCATVALALVSILMGIGEANIPRSVKLLPYGAVAIATILYQLIWMVLLAMWGRVVLWGPMLQRETLPSVLVNTLTMPLAYLLVRALDRRAPDEPGIE
jgi:rod shape-determining protein MreD